MNDVLDKLTRVKLALACLERPMPNVTTAVAVLRDLLEENDVSPNTTAAAPAVAVSIAEAARRLGWAASTVRARIKTGQVPAIGSGRSTRVLIEEALAANRRTASPNADVKNDDVAMPDALEAAAFQWATSAPAGSA